MLEAGSMLTCGPPEPVVAVHRLMPDASSAREIALESVAKPPVICMIGLACDNIAML